jgi:hypothetical protein
LDFLGFPWILSSESSDINGLREIFTGRFFASLSLAREAPQQTPAVEFVGKGGIVHAAAYFNF